MIGYLKSFSITTHELKGAFEEGMGFDGSSIEGYQRIQESDMVAWPVASTAQVLPFRPGGARSILPCSAEVRTPDGTPYIADPRVILAQNLERLEGHGFTHMYIGPRGRILLFQGRDGSDAARPGRVFRHQSRGRRRRHPRGHGVRVGSHGRPDRVPSP